MVDNFKPGLFKFGGFVNSLKNNATKKTFTIKNIQFKSAVYTVKSTPVWLTPFETTANTQILFENCKFENIELKGLGEVILIESQMSNPIIFKNSTFKNIQYGGINI